MSALKRVTTGTACAVSAIIAIVVSNGTVRTSEKGLELIGNAESCRRDPYVCPAGVLTDGIGNTHGVKQGDRKSDEQIAADWEKNILQAESCVNKNGNGNKLNQGQFDAVTSITFNAGCPQMQKSTMYRMLREGKFTEACYQFPRWTYGGGKQLPGLVVRREKEKALCLGN
ncbi:lysozyme [Yersinia enterocolitica]|uniref:lysozyme n=1 Tax=Yersinia enterocolitica TaxID=630 RepID=UPI0005EA014B|nr:lysozyme [Yersinia enterocolitica]EKN5141687.1 lysozyme [Yersinia enterocolitica]ELI8162721.1 lysozyme [Yersinia enterocolitica]CQJ12998.1 putative phage lysozyme [Yersinia enterocolitica]HEA9994986.1 lysozyme [Yersinia enterocolitica]HEG1707006.1 lysozyme [Yersinia enterocolitica]